MHESRILQIDSFCAGRGNHNHSNDFAVIIVRMDFAQLRGDISRNNLPIRIVNIAYNLFLFRRFRSSIKNEFRFFRVFWVFVFADCPCIAVFFQFEFGEPVRFQHEFQYTNAFQCTE